MKKSYNPVWNKSSFILIITFEKKMPYIILPRDHIFYLLYLCQILTQSAISGIHHSKDKYQIRLLRFQIKNFAITAYVNGNLCSARFQKSKNSKSAVDSSNFVAPVVVIIYKTILNNRILGSPWRKCNIRTLAYFFTPVTNNFDIPKG